MTVIARVYLVRHGETAENRDGIIQGHMDTPLNDAGIRQAKLVSEALRLIPIDAAYSSDLSRAATTADEILVHHPNLKLHKQEELRERYMGEQQGKPMNRGARLALSVDTSIESGPQFAARAMTWWKRRVMTISAPRTTPYHALVVTHGGFIGTLVNTLIQSKGARCGKGVVVRRCFNSSVTILEVAENGLTEIVEYASIAHLEVETEAAVETNADEVDLRSPEASERSVTVTVT